VHWLRITLAGLAAVALAGLAVVALRRRRQAVS
jgi:LPXTG-motif cell wall-anchored protein